MNLTLVSLELCVVGLGLLVLLADLWLPPERRRWLGYTAVIGLALLFVASIGGVSVFNIRDAGFGGMFVQDDLAIFFKRFFLLAAIIVLLIAIEHSDRIAAGTSEYYSLILFALAGMLFASSANDA